MFKRFGVSPQESIRWVASIRHSLQLRRDYDFKLLNGRTYMAHEAIVLQELSGALKAARTGADPVFSEFQSGA